MAWHDHIVEHLAATGVDYIFVIFVAGLGEQPRRAGAAFKTPAGTTAR